MPENEFDFNVNFSFDIFLTYCYHNNLTDMRTYRFCPKNKELLVCFDLEENKK